MNISETLSAPFRYVDSLEKKQHILLLYEDPAYARLIEFRFIKNGLADGEMCVYVTHEDSGSVVLKFLSYGIPLHFFQNGKLRVIQMHDDYRNGKDILEKSKEDVKSILDSIIPPYRIVGRIVANVNTIDGITVQMKLEKQAHSCFEDFRGSVMCTYDISKIEKTRKKAWLAELYQIHHAIIHVTKSEQGAVLCPC
jgi:KaiC/GvpD/RAD55 family RecA-like ATPase